MKSLSVRPLILCVQVVIATFPQARKMSGWCPSSSASSPTRFTNFSASRKSGNLNAFVMWCSSMTLQPSTCFCNEASSSPLSGATPPRHETHVLVARSDITTAILALGGAKADDTDARCGHGVCVGVECGAIGKVSSPRGPVMGSADLQRYRKLLLEKQRELSSALGEAQSRVPAAGGLEGDLIEQANADEEAELQIRLHQTDGRLLRAIEEALARIKQGAYGVCAVCKQPISKARLEAVPWRTTAANAKIASTPPLDTGNIGFEPPTGIGNSNRIVHVEFGQTPFPQTVNSPQRKTVRVILPAINCTTTERAVFSLILLRRKMHIRISCTTSN